MPPTRDFRETIRERLKLDPGFREALLEEAVNRLRSGEVDVGKSALRDYVNATIGPHGLQPLSIESSAWPQSTGNDGDEPVRECFPIWK